VLVLYDASMRHSDALTKMIGSRIYTGQTNTKQMISLPSELYPNVATIVPAYGIGYNAPLGELFVAALSFDEESGQIVFPALDSDGQIITEPIAVVFDHRFPGRTDYTRYVAIVERDPNDPGGVLYRVKEYAEAPAVLELTVETEDGATKRVYLPLGAPALGLLAPWLLRLIAAGAASVASYALLKHTDAEQKMAETMLKAIDYAIKLNQTELISAILSGTAAARYEKQNNGQLVSAAKQALGELVEPLVAIFAVFIKLMLLVELIKSMLRR